MAAKRRCRPRGHRADGRAQPLGIVLWGKHLENEGRDACVVGCEMLGRQISVAGGCRVKDVAVFVAVLLPARRASEAQAVAFGVVGELVDLRADPRPCPGDHGEPRVERRRTCRGRWCGPSGRSRRTPARPAACSMMPAALTTTSTPPCSASAWSNSAATCPSSATPARHAVAVPPAARTVATVSSARSGFPAWPTTTAWPSCARRSATARPMAPEAPVTMAARSWAGILNDAGAADRHGLRRRAPRQPLARDLRPKTANKAAPRESTG
jgi:hypothetical protein